VHQIHVEMEELAFKKEIVLDVNAEVVLLVQDVKRVRSLYLFLFLLINFSLKFLNIQIANPCDSRPCINGGICIQDGSGNFTCECVNGFHGRFCQHSKILFFLSFFLFFFSHLFIYVLMYFTPLEFNACLSSPCKNGGRCIVGEGGHSFTCQCTGGFTGPNCQTRILLYFILFLFYFIIYSFKQS